MERLFGTPDGEGGEADFHVGEEIILGKVEIFAVTRRKGYY
jgi:hypothetical protein